MKNAENAGAFSISDSIHVLVRYVYLLWVKTSVGEHAINGWYGLTMQLPKRCLYLSSLVNYVKLRSCGHLVQYGAMVSDNRTALKVNLQATPCDNLAALRINGMVDDVL